MYFANLWGALGLLAIPAILAIHLYHRRFPPLYVAGAHLWAAETQVRMAGRRRDTLPITTTLLLELLAALLLTLVFMQPRFGEFDRVSHLVVVLDNSASMLARPPGQPSLRDQAVAKLKARIEEFGRRTVVTFILSGRRPTMLAGPAVPWNEAEEKLAEWKPSLPRHAFEPSWDLAQQLVEQSGELLFLTDRIPEVTGSSRMEVISVGVQIENVAISAARWTFDSESVKGQVYVRVQNQGTRATECIIRARRGEQAVFEKSVNLSVGGAAALEIPVPGGLGTLEVTATSVGDGLAIDNSVLLVEPKVRSVLVADQLAEGTARTVLERVLKAIPDVGTSDAAGAHLLIAPGSTLPESNSRQWWLGVGPVDEDEAARKAAKDLIGPFVIDKRHPLMDGLVLGGVVWGGVQPVELSLTPLITAGNSPLVGQLRGTRTTGFLLNIDLDRSNLTSSPDWPILINNLIERRRDDLPGLRRWNYRVGEEVRFRLFEGEDPAPATALNLVHATRTKPLVRGRLVDAGAPEETGLFEVRAGTDLFGQFAVNFIDLEESNLRDLRPGRRAAAVPEPPEKFALDNAYSWILFIGTLLILGAVLFDWYVLRPRRFT